MNDVEQVATPPVVAETVAEAFLLLLRSRGIENFYVNAGTDFAPLIEAYARLNDLGEAQVPRPVVATHENLAVGMAHGAYLMSGAPQAVMFHVNVGTANAVCAVMNASAERVPILVVAGRTPLFEGGKLGARNTRVSWGQEMYDQAALVREAVKWDYELRGPQNVGEVIDRALTLAMSEPRGPVYLTLPREVLAEPAVASAAALSEPPVPATSPHPDPAAINRLADRIAAADLPVISSLAAGADPTSAAALAELCDTYAIGYVDEQARYLNLPSDHPMHLGYQMAPVLADADVLCFVESDVPWIPDFGYPRVDAFIAQVGVQPDFDAYPIRTHRRNLAITSTATAFFNALAAALSDRKAQIDPARHARLRQRAEAVRTRRVAASQAARAAELEAAPITYEYLSLTLGDVLHEDCVLFNEYWVARDHVRPTRPKSYFFLPATGGLGWALPAALGAKMEAPERTMVVAIGDGTYMFSNPAACHHASRKHGLPVLTVVCNNARWNGVDLTAKLLYPDGRLAALNRIELSDLSPSPALEQYVIASGGYGEAVERRQDLRGALERGLDAVEREGRQAVINVICK